MKSKSKIANKYPKKNRRESVENGFYQFDAKSSRHACHSFQPIRLVTVDQTTKILQGEKNCF